MDVLPTEINVRILSELPLTDGGVLTLARCGMTGNSTLRDASLEPALWKPYYECRYVHSEHAKESERRYMLAENWREMYQERRRLDGVVLASLKAIEACKPRERVEHARKIVDLGLDVWDALSEEARRPPPALFQKDEDVQKAQSGSPLTNLTRKYWAEELLRIIARRNSIDIWNSLKRYISGEETNSLSFEDAFSCLSSFHGVLPDEVTTHVDREAERCRIHLEGNGIAYAPEMEGFNTKTLCNAVRAYMRSHGFFRAAQLNFYNFRNSLPHLFMTSHRRSLPISLVFVYVGIMKRLGLEASPLNTPNCVTALVRDTIVDVSSFLPNANVGVVENYEEVKHIFTPFNRAVLTAQLLARAARNISMAGVFEYGPTISEERYIDDDVFMWHHAHYLSQVILGLFPSGPADYVEGSIAAAVEPTLFPLDMELVVRDKNLSLSIFVGEDDDYETIDKILERCPSNLSEDIDLNSLFVGQIVRAECTVLRSITGWKLKDGKIMCSTIAYCHHRVYDFPIEALTPVMCSVQDIKRFLRNPILGQFFENAEFRELSSGSDQVRGRFIMNKRFMRLYPDEDARGARWVWEL